MGRVKEWLMEMIEDAHSISYKEFVKKHCKNREYIWHKYNSKGHTNYKFYDASKQLVMDGDNLNAQSE